MANFFHNLTPPGQRATQDRPPHNRRGAQPEDVAPRPFNLLVFDAKERQQAIHSCGRHVVQAHRSTVRPDARRKWGRGAPGIPAKKSDRKGINFLRFWESNFIPKIHSEFNKEFTTKFTIDQITNLINKRNAGKMNTKKNTAFSERLKSIPKSDEQRIEYTIHENRSTPTVK